MAIRPIRADYDNDAEFFGAGIAYMELVQAENRASMRSIDSSLMRHGTNGTGSDKRDKLTGAQIKARDADTFHDFLQKNPALLRKWKRGGIAALFS